MKIRRLTARGVHGYLALDIEFQDDLTFLIGLNGTGKTSALKLIMGLLTPDIHSLASLPFDSAELVLSDKDSDRTIRADKSTDSLMMHITGCEEALELTAAEITLLLRPQNVGEESRSPVLEKALAHSVIKEITELGTPMFLGLDRRFLANIATRDLAEARRKEILMRRALDGDEGIRRGNVAAALTDVNLLVADTMSEIRQRQEVLDANLRNKILTSVFDYKPAVLSELQSPSAESIVAFRESRTDIEHAVKSLRMPVDQVKRALDDFFDRMDILVKHIQRSQQKRKGAQEDRSGDGKRSRKYGASSPPPPRVEPLDQTIIEWMINKPQVDRITDHLSLLSAYNIERNELREPIERFLTLVNSFLADTGKQVFVGERNFLRVSMAHSDDTSLGALSSGERQLVVMLGHLALSKQLAQSGVFIVDEPELSLHISWQERFVEAIEQANSQVQIILATHSPAIILDRDDKCESLDKQEVME